MERQNSSIFIIVAFLFWLNILVYFLLKGNVWLTTSSVQYVWWTMHLHDMISMFSTFSCQCCLLQTVWFQKHYIPMHVCCKQPGTKQIKLSDCKQCCITTVDYTNWFGFYTWIPVIQHALAWTVVNPQHEVQHRSLQKNPILSSVIKPVMLYCI